MKAATMYTLCLLLAMPCELAESRVTVYAPELADPLNCSPPCNITASGAIVEYGVTAACAPERMGEWVFIEGVGIRQCQDTGGAIEGTDVDVAIPIEDCYWASGWCVHPWSDMRSVVFMEE